MGKTEFDVADEMLSGYLDGELTQQDRQRVEHALRQSAAYRKTFDELKAVRAQLGQSITPSFDGDRFREAFRAPLNRTLVVCGGLAIAVGLILLGVLAVSDIAANGHVSGLRKAAVLLPAGGVLALFVAVLRRRLRESATDKYNDVEI
ncbi:MAG: zf-HC2 domain-containing protein [Pseudomonadota bacterium]